jgi:hypothetical protein
MAFLYQQSQTVAAFQVRIERRKQSKTLEFGNCYRYQWGREKPWRRTHKNIVLLSNFVINPSSW